MKITSGQLLAKKVQLLLCWIKTIKKIKFSTKYAPNGWKITTIYESFARNAFVTVPVGVGECGLCNK